jgi:cation transport ATPase
MNCSESGIPIDGVVLFVNGIVEEVILTGLTVSFSKITESKVFGEITFIFENITVNAFNIAENSSIISFKVESFMGKSYLIP